MYEMTFDIALRKQSMITDFGNVPGTRDFKISIEEEWRRRKEEFYWFFDFDIFYFIIFVNKFCWKVGRILIMSHRTTNFPIFSIVRFQSWGLLGLIASPTLLIEDLFYQGEKFVIFSLILRIQTNYSMENHVKNFNAQSACNISMPAL